MPRKRSCHTSKNYWVNKTERTQDTLCNQFPTADGRLRSVVSGREKLSFTYVLLIEYTYVEIDLEHCVVLELGTSHQRRDQRGLLLARGAPVGMDVDQDRLVGSPQRVERRLVERLGLGGE